MFPYRAAAAADGTLYITYGNSPGPNDVTAGAVWCRSRLGEWKDISPAQPLAGEAGWGYAGLALDANHAGTVITSTLDRWRPGDTIFRSDDGGKVWTSLREDAVMDSSYSPFLKDEHGATPFGHWIAALGIDPFDPNHAIYGTGATLWETRDLKGMKENTPTHWAVDTRGIEETAVISLHKSRRGPLLVGLGDIGCFRAERTDARVEAIPFKGLRLSNCDSVAAATANTPMMAAVGRTWNKPHHGGFSIDGGVDWRVFPVEPDGAESGGKVAISADGSAIFWTTRVGTFVTFDQGKVWTTVVPRSGMELEVDPVSSNKAVLPDTKSGALFSLRYRAPSLDTPPDLALSEQSNALPSLHLASHASARDGFWFYGDAGLFQMDPATHDLRKLPGIQAAYALGFGKGEGLASTLFLAGQISGRKGLYRSTDRGVHWTRFVGDGQGFGWITAIAGDPEVFERVYLGTNGLGVLVGDPLSVSKSSEGSPTKPKATTE